MVDTYYLLSSCFWVKRGLYRRLWVKRLIADAIPAFVFGFIDITSVTQHFLGMTVSCCDSYLTSRQPYPEISNGIFVRLIRRSHKIIIVDIGRFGQFLHTSAFENPYSSIGGGYLKGLAVLVAKCLGIHTDTLRCLLDLRQFSIRIRQNPGNDPYLHAMLVCSSQELGVEVSLCNLVTF